MSSTTTISCDTCDCLYDEAHYDQGCPVCTLRVDMQDQIDKLSALIQSHHPQE